MGVIKLIKRYGDFKIRDYIPFLIGIIVMLYATISGFCLRDKSILVVIPLGCAISWILFILRPYNEVFYFEGDYIIVLKRRLEQRRVYIPSKIALVISYTSIDSKSSGRSYILKSKYSITLIHNLCQDDALKSLHTGICYRYTNTDMERIFQQNYIYDFVGNVDLLNIILRRNLEYIIIPQSLYPRIFLPNNGEKIYIDEHY